MTRNQLQFWSNREMERSNRAREFENERANKAQEQLKSKDQRLKAKDQELTKRGQNISMINTGIETAGKLISSIIPGRGLRRVRTLSGSTNTQWNNMTDSQKQSMIDKF